MSAALVRVDARQRRGRVRPRLAGSGSLTELMEVHSWLAALFVLLTLAGCARGTEPSRMRGDE